MNRPIPVNLSADSEQAIIKYGLDNCLLALALNQQQVLVADAASTLRVHPQQVIAMAFAGVEYSRATGVLTNVSCVVH